MTRDRAVEIIQDIGVAYVPRNTEDFSRIDAAWTTAIKSLEAWDLLKDEVEVTAADPENIEYVLGLNRCLEMIENQLIEIES